jgi:hypothetical protein
VSPNWSISQPETFAENSNHSLQHWICDPEAPDHGVAVDAPPAVVDCGDPPEPAAGLPTRWAGPSADLIVVHVFNGPATPAVAGRRSTWSCSPPGRSSRAPDIVSDKVFVTPAASRATFY